MTICPPPWSKSQKKPCIVPQHPLVSKYMYNIQWTIHKYNYIIVGMDLEFPPRVESGAEPEPRPERLQPPESKGLTNN